MTQETNAQKIARLSSEILLHKKRYYNGKAIISDEAYDSLEAELKALDSENPVLSQVGFIIEESEKRAKVIHKPPMLSLEKTYSIEDALAFAQKNKVVCLDKIDGMALSLEYDEKGKLWRASTRGSGVQGENVTEAIYHMTSIPKHLSLGKFSGKVRLEIRGEVFFPTSKFPDFEEEFDSYRNAVPGTFGRKEIEAAIPVLRILEFYAYDLVAKNPDNEQIYSAAETASVLELEKPSFRDKQLFLAHMGFFVRNKNEPHPLELPLEYISATNLDEMTSFIDKKFNATRDYRIDGLVFRIDDETIWEQLGTTSHHPRGSLAFKRESETVVTKILGIEQNIGRSGKITFRAKLEPVQLSNAKISFATLHNAEFIETGKYAPGALVKITRSGEVIPSIIGLHQEAETSYELPKFCLCGFELERRGPDLYCKQKDECTHRNQEFLVYFVKSLNIKGVSDKIILKLRLAGVVKEAADLFRVSVADLLQLEGFAQKSAENVVEAIQARKKVPLASFLTALGISRGGAVKCKDVARKFKTLDNVLKLSAADLEAMPGWAQKSAQEFVDSLASREPIIKNLLTVITVIDEHEEPSASNGPYSGITFCITGALSRSREEYKALIEKQGGRVVDSVSANTAYLVCNEASSSSKYKKAQQLGISIIDEKHLCEMLKI